MFTPLFIGGIGPVELAFILMLAVLLFGAQKLPKLARAAGQSMGEFQKGRADLERELTESVDTSPAETETATETRDAETA